MLNECNIDDLSMLANPAWVYDVERYCIHWANASAIEFWQAETLDDLMQRDFRSSMSEAIFELLKSNLDQYRQGKEHTQWWTLYPKGHEKEVYCHFSGIRLRDNRMAMVVQIISGQQALGTELSNPPSTIIASLWDKNGLLTSANPLFNDLYGSSIREFSELFYSKEEANRLWARALKEREYETELYVPTPSGEQSHYIQIRVNQSKAGNLFVVRQFIKQEDVLNKKGVSEEAAVSVTYRQQQMRHRICKAMSAGEFCVDYLSVKYAQEDRLYAVEGVVTWKSPELGSIPAAEFMPMADDHGISALLGHYVLEKACDQLMQWGSDGKPLAKLIMTLSPSQILTPNYLKAMSQLLKRTGFPADQLIIFIDGEALIKRSPILLDTVRSLRLMGVMLASDGARFSRYKADGSTVIDTLEDIPLTHVKLSPAKNSPPIDEADIERVMSEAHKSGLQIIASNISATWELQLMTVLGCGLYQGALAGLVNVN